MPKYRQIILTLMLHAVKMIHVTHQDMQKLTLFSMGNKDCKNVQKEGQM